MKYFSGFKAALVGGAFALLPVSVFAQNGLIVNPRVFNNFPTSTLVVTTSNSIPGSANINDSNAPPGNGANRDDVLVSDDHGATAQTRSAASSFTFSANLDLTGGANSPRKEGGLRINGAGPDQGNDALFIVNTDAHEIVAFGGPFYSFASQTPGGYQAGQTIFLEMQYDAGAQTMTYFENDGGGLQTSGPLSYTPVPNFQLGVYGQWAPASTSDFINAAYTNISVSNSVPEPASLSLLAVGSVTLLARRRAKNSVN